MNVFTNLETLPSEIKDQVVAIGNFDGVHKGHQTLLETTLNISQNTNRTPSVLTFEPHPRRLFRPDDPPFRITPYDLKIAKLEEFGAHAVISHTFDWAFASQSAEDFIQNILIKGLNASHVIIGEDFCFGQLRKGTPDTIRAAGLDVTTISPKTSKDGTTYSSSTIRQNLRQGDITRANELLGWEWEMRGTVIRGDQRGRELGYPTANVPLKDTLHPAYGIYAAWVQIEGETEWRPSATNIGIRPMFELQEGQVEAHILGGFHRDIYGRNLRIKPVKRLRGEAKFDTLEALCIQMDKDCAQSLQTLGL